MSAGALLSLPLTPHFLLAGLLNAESCRFGSPAFISFPHFLHADPFLLDTVEGLSPNMDDHHFHIDLIPVRASSSQPSGQHENSYI